MNRTNVSGYSQKEEFINFLTHGIGAVLSVIGVIFLLINAFSANNPLMIVSYLIYGLSLISLYSASSFYHLAKDESQKLKFKKLDHICIYYLIAGTYTPLMLNNLGGQVGIGTTIGVWVIALFGTIYKLKSKKQNKFISTGAYLLMGWVVLFIWPQLKAGLNEAVLEWLIIGGLFYSVGVIFYVMKKVPYTHAIWHLFVLAGSISHFISITLA
ncbi:hypothetical protein A9Q84_03965 [Halobacteriovorax marinus]|uniref:Hemolysin III n=1 Tax=Halobacteriovorax marinus TaxID=97084 RepID=A0A1Y5FAQ0_9BACT|nr:hypothetical protein A9Q84_03965 [Halobacteriovorax marinus]